MVEIVISGILMIPLCSIALLIDLVKPLEHDNNMLLRYIFCFSSYVYIYVQILNFFNKTA